MRGRHGAGGRIAKVGEMSRVDKIDYMSRLDGKTVLIGQGSLQLFAGSEIVALELAEHFARRCANVVIAVRISGEPMLTEVAATARIRVLDVDDPRLNDELQTADIHMAGSITT
jgi:hypothetical protein